MVSIETVDGATFLKLDGITRFIWLPRALSPDRVSGIRFNRENWITVVMWRGWGFVVAPFRPKAAGHYAATGGRE